MNLVEMLSVLWAILFTGLACAYLGWTPKRIKQSIVASKHRMQRAREAYAYGKSRR